MRRFFSTLDWSISIRHNRNSTDSNHQKNRKQFSQKLKAETTEIAQTGRVEITILWKTKTFSLFNHHQKECLKLKSSSLPVIFTTLRHRIPFRESASRIMLHDSLKRLLLLSILVRQQITTINKQQQRYSIIHRFARLCEACECGKWKMIHKYIFHN